MSRRKKEPTEVSVAKIVLIGTIITGLLSLGGILITQYFQVQIATKTENAINTQTPIIPILPTTTPIYSPKDGTIAITSEYRNYFHSGVQAKNFSVKVTFFAPYSPSKGNWDAGIFFGNRNWIVVTSSGKWVLRPKGDFLNLPAPLSLQEGSPTSLTLVVYENSGCFFVNDNFVADLDLSTVKTLGEISLATGNFTGNALTNETASLKFSGFEIYAIDSIKCH